MTNSILNPFFDICAKPAGDEKRTTIFKNAKCINANGKKIQTCAESNKDMIFYILESSYERRIPIACCQAKRIADCTYNKTVELCDRAHADFQNEYYQGVAALRDICESKCIHARGNLNNNITNCLTLLFHLST